MKSYVLEIYAPGTADDPLCRYESDTPFGAINSGDLLNAILTPTGDHLLRVNQVEHIIWETKAEGLRHRLCVFTEHAENMRETRIGRAG